MWIELHDTARDHPKMRKLAKELNISRVCALGHMVSLWTWTLRMAPDGDLASFEDEDIEIDGAEWTGKSGAFIAAARKHKLLEGKKIHDWEDFAGSLKAAKRAKISRENKLLNKERAHACAPVRDSAHACEEFADQTRPDRPDQNDQTDRPDQSICSDLENPKSEPAAPQKEPDAPIVTPEDLAGLTLYQNNAKLCKAWPDMRRSFEQAYGNIDVLAELRKAHAWEVANPKKRKVDKLRFLGSWMARAQDYGGNGQNKQSNFKTKETLRSEATKRAMEEWLQWHKNEDEKILHEL